jgi:hypothetical protein
MFRVILAILKFLAGWGGLLIGGVHTAVRGFGELVKAVDELMFRFWDYRVFEVIDTPRARASEAQMIRTAIGRAISGPEPKTSPSLKPYSVAEIATRTGRKSRDRFAKTLKETWEGYSCPLGMVFDEQCPAYFRSGFSGVQPDGTQT